MPQKTLRFKIYQDGKVEETLEGFIGNSCNDVTKNLENSLGQVTLKSKTTEAYTTNQGKNSEKSNIESNVTF